MAGYKNSYAKTNRKIKTGTMGVSHNVNKQITMDKLQAIDKEKITNTN